MEKNKILITPEKIFISKPVDIVSKAITKPIASENKLLSNGVKFEQNTKKISNFSEKEKNTLKITPKHLLVGISFVAVSFLLITGLSRTPSSDNSSIENITTQEVTQNNITQPSQNNPSSTTVANNNIPETSVPEASVKSQETSETVISGTSDLERALPTDEELKNAEVSNTITKNNESGNISEAPKEDMVGGIN